MSATLVKLGMKADRLGIRARLIIAFLVLSLFHVVFFGIAFIKQRQADEFLHQVVGTYLKKLSVAQQMVLTTHQLRSLHLYHVLSLSPATMRQLESDRRVLLQRFAAWEESYRNTVSSDEEKRLFEAFVASFQGFITKADTTIRLSAERRKAEAGRWAAETVGPAYDEARLKGERLNAYVNAVIARQTALADRLRYQVFAAFVALVIVELLVIAFVTSAARRHISQPLEDLAVKIRDILDKSQINEKVQINGPREVAHLAESFNHMTSMLRQRFREFNGLLDTSRLAAASLDPREVMRTILDNAAPLIGCRQAAGFVLDRNERVLNLAIWPGRAVDPDARGGLFLGRGCVWRAALDGKPVVVKPESPECRLCGFVCGNWAREQGIGAIIAVPLVGREHAVGVMLFMMKEPEVRKETLRLAEALANQAALVVENARLFDNLKESYLSTVIALAAAVEARDPYTRNHCERVAEYAEALAREAGLTPKEVEDIRQASLLHDIGKIGIPDRVLLKQGRLTPAEYEVIKLHPVISASIIADIPFLADIVPLIRHHHERVDGTGYPDRLKGDEIPLGARIIAIADAYDAMTGDRPYRSALTKEQALAELVRCNEQFDGVLVRKFLKVMSERNGEATSQGFASLPADT